VPIDPSLALTLSVNNGVGYAENYIEIYQIDVANLPTTISYAHHAITHTTPTPIPTATPTPTPAQTKPWPAGIISLCPPDTIQNPIGDLSQIPGWTNPYVDGFRLRECWNVIEPQEGTYNWTTIDQAVSLGSQYGKKIGVSVSAGIYTPQWVYDSGATQYDLVDGSGNAMPLPWEAVFQNKWRDFITAFGARYDANPNLAYVCPTGFMQVTVMYFSQTTQDETNLTALAVLAGYDTLEDAYVPAAETIIAAHTAAFPTTAVILNPVQPFVVGGQDAVDTIRDFGFATYPGQFGTMYPQAATPPPHPSPSPPTNYPNGSQMLCVASNTDFLYLPPAPSPPPPAPIPLQDALEYAVTLDHQYVEIYGNDIKLDVDQPVLQTEGIKLKANLPPPP
jgi:hypothetical protein